MAYKSNRTGEEIDALLDKVANIEPSSGSTYKEVTYLELRQMRDAGALEVGAQYRITDYVASTSQSSTRSANHPFDLIVTALDSNTLSEEALAVKHKDDTYFSNSKLEAWRVWYCLDNDTNRFNWAVQEVEGRPQYWRSYWGKFTVDEGSTSPKYVTKVIDGVTKYLYRPNAPTDYLEYTPLERREIIGSVSSVDDLVFESYGRPYEYDGEWYWDDVYDIDVRTKDGGHLIASLYYDYSEGRNAIFYDANDDYEFAIIFNPETEEIDDSTYRFTSPDRESVEYWWNNLYDGYKEIESVEQFYGNQDSLYYAFDSVLDEYTRDVTEVYSSETNKIYYYYGEDDYGDPTNILDYIEYYAPVEAVCKTGVIYRLIDDRHNDLPYDFKGIQLNYGGKWRYAFTYKDADLSLTNRCGYNKVNPYLAESSVVASIPVLSLELTNTSSIVGIYYNEVETRIERGLVSVGQQISANKWVAINQPRCIQDLNISIKNSFVGNVIRGTALLLEIGEGQAIGTMMMNTIWLGYNTTYSIYIKGSGFNRTFFNFLNSNGDVEVKCGYLYDCEIEDAGKVNTDAIGGIEFNQAITHSRFRIFDKITFTYTPPSGTNSTSNPLRFLDVDLRGTAATTVNIPSTFPLSSDYTLKIAKNSSGSIKCWTEADLIG